MIGSIISKHGIKIAVALLILGATYNYLYPKPKEIEGYKVFSFNNNALFFKGDISDQLALDVGKYLQKTGFFSNVNSLIFVIDAKTKMNEGIVSFMIPIDPTKLNKTLKIDAAKLWIDIKNGYFKDKKIEGCFTNPQLAAIQCYPEQELNAYYSNTPQNKQNSDSGSPQQQTQSMDTENIKEKGWTLEEIIKKWDSGATKIANAQHYLEINNNRDWRIYYTEQYSQVANELSKIIYENKLVKEGYLDYFALYSANETYFNNGQPAYHFALPFNEKELKNGEAEKKADEFYKIFKNAYMKDVRLVIALCDYEFNVAKIFGR